MRGGGGQHPRPDIHGEPDFGGVAIARYGTEAMRRDLLPPLIAGDIQCCMALTEPDAGTNSLELRTFAEAHGNGWRLNGRKIWISAVPTADKMLVVARTKKVEESQRRTDGISLFLVDVEREGLTHSTIEKAGTHCVPASNVYFENTPVAGDELVGHAPRRLEGTARRAQHRAHRHHRRPCGNRCGSRSGSRSTTPTSAACSATGRSPRTRGCSSRSPRPRRRSSAPR